MHSVFSLDSGLITKSHSEHIKLIEALKRKDTNIAVKLVEEQKERAFSELLQHFKEDKKIKL